MKIDNKLEITDSIPSLYKGGSGIQKKKKKIVVHINGN